MKRGGDPRCQGVLRCQPMSQGEYILQKSLSTFEETYRRTPFVARGILFKGSMPSPSLFSLVFNSNQQQFSLCLNLHVWKWGFTDSMYSTLSHTTQLENNKGGVSDQPYWIVHTTHTYSQFTFSLKNKIKTQRIPLANQLILWCYEALLVVKFWIWSQ